MVQGGKEDAYGHRKLGGIGQLTGELLHELTGEGIIHQQIGYLMRSGSPDSLDLMVAINYAVMAADLLIEGEYGRLVALRNGNYVNVPLDVTRQGVKRVDVDALYDVDDVPAEDPPRRRQADVPVLSADRRSETARYTGGPERSPRRSAFGHRHQALGRDARGHGRGRGRRRLVRRRPDREPPAGARGRGHRAWRPRSTCRPARWPTRSGLRLHVPARAPGRGRGRARTWRRPS